MSTAYDQIVTCLNDWQPFINFMNGGCENEYFSHVLENEEHIINTKSSINHDKLHLTTRFPLNVDDFVDSILDDLFNRGIIKKTNYDKPSFYLYKTKVDKVYKHLSYQTFIFPEEEQLLYALSQIIEPKNVVLMGSYYGYWGVWLMPAIKKNDGKAYFIDLDNDVNQLTRENFDKMDFKENAEIITGDAVTFLKESQMVFDFGVLDAECNPDNENEEYRGKKVYYPLIKECETRLRKGGFIIAHNILLSNKNDDWYFNEKIKQNNTQFTDFFKFTNLNFRKCVDYQTTEGVGVYYK